jgi:hypothetical protein
MTKVSGRLYLGVYSVVEPPFGSICDGKAFGTRTRGVANRSGRSTSWTRADLPRDVQRTNRPPNLTTRGLIASKDDDMSDKLRSREHCDEAFRRAHLSHRLGQARLSDIS